MRSGTSVYGMFSCQRILFFDSLAEDVRKGNDWSSRIKKDTGNSYTFPAGNLPDELSGSPYHKVFLLALAAAQKYNIHKDRSWNGDKKEADTFIGPYLFKNLDDCEVPEFEDEIVYLFSEERYEKDAVINTLSSDLMEHIQAMKHTDEEHGLYREKEREWIYRVTELLLKYHSLEDHLCNAGRREELQFEIETVMKEHLAGRCFDTTN